MPKFLSAPAAELQDVLSGAVAAFLKSANHTISSAEERHQEEVRRALQDVRETQRERDELRRERDAFMQEKMAAAVDLEAAKGEVERWRVSSEKGEWVINHQSETITQLRLEAQQWKDQFMRVDEERLRLSARNDELVSQQLYLNRRDTYHQEPLTPRSQGPQAQGSSSTRAASSNQYEFSSVPANGYVTDGDVLGRRTSRGQSLKQPPRQKEPTRNMNAYNKFQPPVASSSRRVSQSQTASTPGRVLHTVHVVMQGGGVKEESESVDSAVLAGGSAGSESFGEDEEAEVAFEPPPPRPTQTQKRAVGKGKMSVQSRNKQRKWSEGKRIYDEESENGSASDGDGDGDGDVYVPPSKSRTRRDNDGDDEDEDELILGGGVDRNETYGIQKAVSNNTHTPARRAQTQPAKQANTSGGPTRKRNSPYVSSGAGKKPRNR